jgi:hypothetical protein
VLKNSNIASNQTTIFFFFGIIIFDKIDILQQKTFTQDDDMAKTA